MRIWLGILTLSLASHLTRAVTLQEAENEPDKFVFYSRGPHHRFANAAIAMVITYGALVFLVGSVATVAKATGATRRRREHKGDPQGRKA